MNAIINRTAIAALATVLAIPVAAQDRQFVNIGTAGIGGGYYPTGGFICNMVNRSREAQGHNIRCTVESTGGSVANLRSMAAGEMDVAIVQSDWQHHAYSGTSEFSEAGPNEDLRFLFSLHVDTGHLVARSELDLETFADLEGKIVNIGNPGSGQQASMIFALKQYGTDPESYFGQVTQLTSREQAMALCDGNVDAFWYTTGVPGATISEAMNTCDAEILSWYDETVAKMIEEYPYFTRSVIPAGSYERQEEDEETWGLVATIVAGAGIEEETIYNLVKAVFDNFDEFKAQSSLYQNVTREGAATAGRSVPYHPGAERYFRETGLID